MLIFIKDQPIDFVKDFQDSFFASPDFVKIDSTQLNQLEIHKLQGKVLLKGINVDQIESLLDALTNPLNTNPLVLILECTDMVKTKRIIKTYFEVVKAAGGLIKNENGELLMIKRLGKWDLPKGKKEKNEKPIETAKREVEEECNIEIKVGRKLVTSWHTYSMKNHKMLKQTKWFDMLCKSDNKMKPQIEENIEEIKWMNSMDLAMAMQQSYASIGYIIEKGSISSKYQVDKVDNY